MNSTPRVIFIRLAVPVALLAFLGAGCAAPAPVASDVRIIDVQQDDSHLKVAAVRGQAHVTIAINKPRTADKLLRSGQPSAEPYEPGVVAHNRRDFPFLSTAVTPEMTQMAETAVSNTQQEQLEDLRLVVDATKVLQERSDIDRRYREDLRSLYYMATSSLEGANDMIDGKITPEPTPDICAADPSILAPGEYERLCPPKQ